MRPCYIKLSKNTEDNLRESEVLSKYCHKNSISDRNNIQAFTMFHWDYFIFNGENYGYTDICTPAVSSLGRATIEEFMEEEPRPKESQTEGYNYNDRVWDKVGKSEARFKDFSASGAHCRIILLGDKNYGEIHNILLIDIEPYVGQDKKVSQSIDYKIDLSAIVGSSTYDAVVSEILAKLGKTEAFNIFKDNPYVFIYPEGKGERKKSIIAHSTMLYDFDKNTNKEITWQEYLGYEPDPRYNHSKESQVKHEEKELSALPKKAEKELPTAPATMMNETYNFGYRTKLV